MLLKAVSMRITCTGAWLQCPSGGYSNRKEYLKRAVPKGFHMRVLIFNGEVVGTIEYAPAEVSGYSIVGEGMIVMNFILILRKARGHDFGKLLEKDMVNSEKDAGGFARIALENIGVHGSRKV
jgi:hypothetical protein